MIGDDLLGHQLRPLDGLAKERLGTRRVAMVAEQYVDDLAVLVNRRYRYRFSVFRKRKTSSTNQRLPTRRRRRTSAASKGPNTWDYVRIVRCDTSMPRSASSSSTWRLESG